MNHEPEPIKPIKYIVADQRDMTIINAAGHLKVIGSLVAPLPEGKYDAYRQMYGGR